MEKTDSKPDFAINDKVEELNEKLHGIHHIVDDHHSHDHCEDD